MFCAGRVDMVDMRRTMNACGGSILTTVKNIDAAVLGNCESFEELQIGGDRFNVFKGCPNAHTCTFILRGGAEQFLEETERSLHDAIMIVRRTIKNDAIVAGGGAIEMELSRMLRDHSKTICGKFNAYRQVFNHTRAMQLKFLIRVINFDLEKPNF